ncbi:MAG: hypothetical protein IKZ28_00875, partial [Clostridia bacterium]|nr:hypothetical protein [Clostridia bacterium]
MRKRKKITKIFSLCLAFVGVLATTSCEGFISLIKGNTPTENSTPPHPNWYWEKEEGVLINSLDKWYYYAGKKTLEEYFASSLNCTESTGEIVPVADYGYGYETSDGKVIEGESPVDNGNIPPSNDTVVYYDLCDFNELVVNRTVYFQMELTEEDGFLARRLGTGKVEVVVSLGDYDEDLSMITFRNGDKFYSCMYHGYGGLNEETGAEKYYFAAYRYIEGFYYVK